MAIQQQGVERGKDERLQNIMNAHRRYKIPFVPQSGTQFSIVHVDLGVVQLEHEVKAYLLM